MKTLKLLRHAKSCWDDAATRDFDRPLNQRGRRAAQTVGREMRSLGLRFDQVIASPAVRVVETLREVEEGYGEPLRPDFDRRVYLASAETLLDLVHSARDDGSALLLVGHNPGLENLAIQLGAGGPLEAEIAIKYPTATLTEISFPVERWADVRVGGGTITRFIRPRDLDPQLGPDGES